MTGNEYQEAATRTINLSLSEGQLMNHALHGMVGEIGEIHSIFQKQYQGHPIQEDELKKEVGDLLWFVAEFCTSNGWWIEDVMEENIEKLYKRYPEGFDRERSVHREEQ